MNHRRVPELRHRDVAGSPPAWTGSLAVVAPERPSARPAVARQAAYGVEQRRKLEQAGDRLAEQVENYALPPWPWRRKLRSAVKEWQRARLVIPLD